MTHKISVSNIACGGCVSSIKNALSKIEGVESVNVEQASQTVNVEGPVEKSVLVQTLSDLGYPERA